MIHPPFIILQPRPVSNTPRHMMEHTHNLFTSDNQSQSPQFHASPRQSHVLPSGDPSAAAGRMIMAPDRRGEAAVVPKMVVSTVPSGLYSPARLIATTTATLLLADRDGNEPYCYPTANATPLGLPKMTAAHSLRQATMQKSQRYESEPFRHASVVPPLFARVC